MTQATVRRLTREESTPRSEAYERLREEANPREVRKAVEGMSDDMLLCRRMRQHSWTPSAASKVRGGYREVLVCTRCEAVKERKYNGRGHVMDYGTVRYPEGYLLKGVGRLGEAGRDVINLASLQRAIEKLPDLDLTH